MTRSSRILRPLVVAAALCGPAGVSAQKAPPLQWESRLDAITGDDWAIHAGLGVTAPLGTYARFGIVSGAGAGAGGTSGRTELLARFTLDPFRERRWTPYAAGGVSARYGEGSGAYMVLLAGVEGPVRGGLTPAVEFGFGGSFRGGFVLRQGFPRRR